MQQRSLQHEYELYIEREIEAYKESVSRTVLLSIGDEAVASLRDQQQLALTELLVWQVVDRIIMRRLGLPRYSTWRSRRLRRLKAYRRPEHWGFAHDAPIVKASLTTDGEPHVLVSGTKTESSALFMAAHGWAVTAVEAEVDNMERVMAAAYDTGLTSRVHGFVADLASFVPGAPLTAVVCTPDAFAGLSLDQRARAIAVLQSATRDGGVHLVETIIAGQAALTLDELRARYDGWQISVENGRGSSPTFVARKLSA